MRACFTIWEHFVINIFCIHRLLTVCFRKLFFGQSFSALKIQATVTNRCTSFVYIREVIGPQKTKQKSFFGPCNVTPCTLLSKPMATFSFICFEWRKNLQAVIEDSWYNQFLKYHNLIWYTTFEILVSYQNYHII